MSDPLVISSLDNTFNWPEPDRDYLSTCRSCKHAFLGPKRALCCYQCYSIGMERRKEGEAAYDKEHSEPSYGFSETSLAVYREGWISGWITAKYSKP